MYDDWNDPEAIEQERHDADVEMVQLQEAGREAARGYRAMLRLRKAGRLQEAAAACSHGWGYPTHSPAAVNNNDPRAGQPGERCLHCGSWWSAAAVAGLAKFCESSGVIPSELRGVAATAPCELEPRQ